MYGIPIGADRFLNGIDCRVDATRRLVAAVILRALRDARGGGKHSEAATAWLDDMGLAEDLMGLDIHRIVSIMGEWKQPPSGSRQGGQ